MYINSQLKNINIIINNINEDIKKNNNLLTQLKINYIPNKNIFEKKNEINFIYDKQDERINLLHDYNQNINNWDEKIKLLYSEGKNNINENNVEIYINDKKIKFDYIYQSKEKGDIKVKLVFKKILKFTSWMFSDCPSLKSIDLTSFNTSNIIDMSYMFNNCASLKSIDFSSFDSSNVKNTGFMFWNCSCLKKENVKIKDTEKKILDELNNI